MLAEEYFFRVEKHETYLIVKFSKNPESSDLRQFETQLELISGNHVILDCDSLIEADRDFIRILLKLHLATKKDNKFLKFINVSSSLLTFFKKESLDTTFKIAQDLKDALSEIGVVPKRSISTDFIDSFLQSTIKVLKIQADIDVSHGGFEVTKTQDNGICDISGVIGIICNNFNGSVIISFPEKTFLNVLSKMLGDEIVELSSENMDGAAELANMIFGQAKLTLNEKGFGLKMALPSVILGKPDSFLSLHSGTAILIPFYSNEGHFYMRIGLSA
jgi:CheY-specific phosphatase CheX